MSDEANVHRVILLLILTYNPTKRNASCHPPEPRAASLNPALLIGKHLPSLIHYRKWISDSQTYETPPWFVPDKREVVSSILTRPIFVNPFLRTCYVAFSGRRHRTNSPKTADCELIVSKNFRCFVHFGIKFSCSDSITPFQDITYGTLLYQRKLCEVCVNCEQKLSHLIFGR